MSKRDYYETLGVTKTATKTDIKKAYRKLAKEKHPDRNKAANAETEFKEVQEAYEILSDENKRKAYDQYGHAGAQGFGSSGFGSGAGGFEGFGGGGGFEDLNDIFSQFFGDSFGGFGRSGGARSAGTRGADIEATLRIEFDEAVFGKYKTISYMRKVGCSHCDGTGAENSSAYQTCHDCKGTGTVTRIQQTFLGSIQTSGVCPTCNGKGKIITSHCKHCKGEGREEKAEDFKIKIPPGIPDNVTLRFADRGNAGKNGGNYGDLYITIEIEPHASLERRGDDIYSEVEIDPVTAVLGGDIPVDSVRGEISLKIPAGTQPGKIFRLSGKGGPKFRGQGNGDQYVQVKVTIPQKLSRKQRELWESLEEVKQDKPGLFS